MTMGGPFLMEWFAPIPLIKDQTHQLHFQSTQSGKVHCKLSTQTIYYINALLKIAKTTWS